MTRGVALGLSLDQVHTRLLYLGGLVPASKLDDHVTDRHDAHRVDGYDHTDEHGDFFCTSLYYLLKDHNGGKDPTALDPADRWSFPGKTFVNRTADCIGGMAWAGGFDRYQPTRFHHIYDGWINTDSMIQDATRDKRCFTTLDHPEPGCFVVCASGSRGHGIGHIGGVIQVADKFDYHNDHSWSTTMIVDVAAWGPGIRANTKHSMLGWFNTNAVFVKSIMTP